MALPCARQLQGPPISSSAQIRARFLNRLGISQPEPQSLPQERKKRADVSPCILRGKVVTFQDLKGDHGRLLKNDSELENDCGLATTSRRRPRTVSFDSCVKVRWIPKHTEYSDRIRDQLWIKALVQHKNVARNCMEFAAEGWNWQQVEEEMIVCANGEKVHPIHFTVPHNNLGWRFCSVRAMQQRCHHYK